LQIHARQQLGSHNPFKVKAHLYDSGAFDHIFGNTSLFPSLSFPKNPDLITLANGSKVSSKGVGLVSLSCLNLKYVLFVPTCPFNVISFSQLTMSLNCSKIFDANSFAIYMNVVHVY